MKSDVMRGTDYQIRLNREGVPTPRNFPEVLEGDTLTFFADDGDCVLCFDKRNVFGVTRVEILDGESARLTVQEVDSFEWHTKTDLNWGCMALDAGTGGSYPPG